MIQQSGISYEVGPFATVIEGPYQDVIRVIHEINEQMIRLGCPEWIMNMQLQIRCDRDMTALEKVEKFRHLRE